MKKKYLLALLLFLPILTHSQSTATYGFKGGLSFGNAEAKDFNLDNIELDTKFRTSLYLGAFVEYSLENISENLYTQLELQYVSSGAKIGGASTVQEIKLSQLNLPFVLKYRVAEPFTLTAGIYWGLLLQVEEESSEGETLDAKEDFETFDSGLLIGAEVPIGEDFFLELRYNYGLLDLRNLEKTNNRGSYFNRFIQLGVGVRL